MGFLLGSGDFLGFLGTAGFDFDCVAFVVESDYFYRVTRIRDKERHETIESAA